MRGPPSGYSHPSAVVPTDDSPRLSSSYPLHLSSTRSKLHQYICTPLTYSYHYIVLFSLHYRYLRLIASIHQDYGHQHYTRKDAPNTGLARMSELFKRASANCRRALIVSSVALCYGAYTAWFSDHTMKIVGLATITISSVAIANVAAVATFLPSIDIHQVVELTSPEEMETIAIVCATPVSSLGWCTIMAAITLLLHITQTSPQPMHDHRIDQKLPSDDMHSGSGAGALPPSLPIWGLACIGSVVWVTLLRLTVLHRSLEKICGEKDDVVHVVGPTI